jgi:uncharacterized membrane protein
VKWWLILCILVSGAAAYAGDPVQVDVHRENGKILLAASFVVPVSRELAWSVLTDFEHMPQFLPNLKTSHILQRDGNLVRVMQQGVIPLVFLQFSYESTRDIELTPMQGVHSHSVGGNSGAIEAFTRLELRDQMVRIQYSAVWTPASSLVASLGLDTLREQLVMQFQAFQQEMLKRAKIRPASALTPVTP